MPYKNSTSCQKMSKVYLPKTELSEEILKYVVSFRVMVMGFQSRTFSTAE